MQTYKTGNDSVFWTAEDGDWVPAEVAQGLYDALHGLLSSHDDFVNCGKNPSLGTPDIEWSEEFAEQAREALAAADGEEV